jgi:hypothetical protein
LGQRIYREGYMATIAPATHAAISDDRFFMRMAIVIAFTIIAGFALHFAMGRSTITARPLVHVHGLVFMGWVVLFLTQVRLATGGSLALHRRLGWIAAGWACVLVVMGLAITIDVAMRGGTPFFFLPQYFLIANPMSLLCFVALTTAAIRMRRRTDWHKRLHLCATVSIIGPGLGRLMPMPLMGPYSFDIVILISLLFPAAGMIHDWRQSGQVHRAWVWGALAIFLIVPTSQIIARSPVGDMIYAAVTQGHPGEKVPGLEFPPPPMPQ